MCEFLMRFMLRYGRRVLNSFIQFLILLNEQLEKSKISVRSHELGTKTKSIELIAVNFYAEWKFRRVYFPSIPFYDYLKELCEMVITISTILHNFF